jgi:hypothetical protein
MYLYSQGIGKNNVFFFPILIFFVKNQTTAQDTLGGFNKQLEIELFVDEKVCFHTPRMLMKQ